MVLRLSLIVLSLAFLGSRTAGAQQITKPTIPGAINVVQLETTVACGGATKPEAVPEIKKLGFASIINLRQPTESGADVDGEAAAAKSAGIRFYNIPFNGQSPDPAAADRFLDTITAPGNAPAYIHCAGGNRAAAMWMIKRLVVDRWEADKAAQEAQALGMTSAPLKQFAIDYAKTHTR
jgi:uncharacterized protein (TIGR01244 family)